MKALAAVNIRQYEKAVESLSEYNRAVEMGFQIILKQKPPEVTMASPVTSEHWGGIVFGSDQGMVGQFNEVVARHAVDELEQGQVRKENLTLLAAGARVAARLDEAGYLPEGYISLPSSVSAIAPVVQQLVLKVEAWRLTHAINKVTLFFNRPLSGASYRPHTLQLLPVDTEWFQTLTQRPWACRAIPLFTMDWNRLFSLLVRQYLFVSLYRAFAESLASENASRLASMQVAERNIENRLDELSAQHHQQRQDAIDAELFDLVAGFEALSGKAPES